MATNFSPCMGSYVSNQFPSNVMFGKNGFHVSASGAIQDHHGPLVASTALKFTHVCLYISCEYAIFMSVRLSVHGHNFVGSYPS